MLLFAVEQFRRKHATNTFFIFLVKSKLRTTQTIKHMLFPLIQTSKTLTGLQEVHFLNL